jgi:hypothetical protein
LLKAKEALFWKNILAMIIDIRRKLYNLFLLSQEQGLEDMDELVELLCHAFRHPYPEMVGFRVYVNSTGRG